jgi:glycosyltransferase involved in cell wall biosynthesis
MKPVLWWSNAPTVGTGYGTQTKQVLDRLAFYTHVEFVANYGVEGAPSEYRTPLGLPIKMWPRGFAPFSNDVIGAHWEQFVADYPDAVYIGLADAFVLAPEVYQSVPMHLWTPVEHVPCPPDLLRVFDFDESTIKPIAMSKFGQQELAKAGIPSTYIPHGIEPTFRPTEGGGELMGVPDDAFVFSIVAANKYHAPERKRFSSQMVAFQTIAKKHPDTFLYIHADTHAPQSITLIDLVNTLGLQGRVKFADRRRYNMWGYTQQDVAAIYTRTDMILSTSMGEGFGLCPLEAAACGTPAIVSNFSAQPELACEDSLMVDGQLEWHQGRRSFLYIPYTESIADAMEHAYQNPTPRSEAALALAAKYDADRVFNTYWLPYLEAL